MTPHMRLYRATWRTTALTPFCRKHTTLAPYCAGAKLFLTPSSVRYSTWMSVLPVHSMKCQKALIQVTLSHLLKYLSQLGT